MSRPFENKEHLVRVAGLFAAGFVIMLLLQAVLMPAGFGVYGHFRAPALQDVMNHPLQYAGRDTCVECHKDVGETLRGGKHKGVNCEACHGPLARHADDASAQKAEKPDAKALCPRCHTANVAKPQGFPSVDPAEHSSGASCTECHTAHSPAQ